MRTLHFTLYTLVQFIGSNIYHEICCFKIDSPLQLIGDAPWKITYSHDDTIRLNIGGLTNSDILGWTVRGVKIGLNTIYHYSDIHYYKNDNDQPTKVELDSICSYDHQSVKIYWRGVFDTSGYVDKYLIYRLVNGNPYSGITPFDTVETIHKIGLDDTCYVYPTLIEKGKIYTYMVEAVDEVFQRGKQDTSGLVKAIPKPVIKKFCEDTSYSGGNEIYYAKGTSNTIIIDSTIFTDTSVFVKYQYAEGVENFYNNHSELEWHSSDWTRKSVYEFECIGKPTFVHGQQFAYRVKAKKENHNTKNYSISDTCVAVHDVLPPEDINRIWAFPERGTSLNNAPYIYIGWESATDKLSKIKKYIVWRKIVNEDTIFKDIAILDPNKTNFKEPFYKDPFDSIGVKVDIEKFVLYRITSIDGAGNERKSTNKEASAVTIPAAHIQFKDVQDTTDLDFLFIHLDLEACPKYDKIISAYLKKWKLIKREAKPDSLYSYDEKEIKDFINQYVRVDFDTTGIFLFQLDIILENYECRIHSNIVKIVIVNEESSKILQDDIKETSKGFLLLPNYPNPFNQSTCITYHIALGNSEVIFEIINLKGQIISRMYKSINKPGIYKFIWDGVDDKGLPVPSGLYFYKIIVFNQGKAQYRETKKMMLLK